MIFDTHIHTKFSSDCNMDLVKGIAAAKKLNLGLTITDHMDLNYPEKGKFVFNIEDFFKVYEPFKSEEVLLGIELGMDANYKNENEAIHKNYPFDQITGSQHFLYNFDVYDSALYEGRAKEDVFRDYLLEVVKSLKTHSYIDTLAHIDFICRYNPYEDQELYYKDFSDYIDEILKLCIEYNIAMEINTRRLGNDLSLKSLTEIYGRYKELGGKYVTIGSDSHTENSIGFNLHKGLKLSESLCLTPVYFKERKMHYIKKEL
jgi:histidinol-phosphatase (PHP family)